MIIKYPVQTIHGEKTILAEIQIRTLAMNFWASIEHSLNYKYEGEMPDEISIGLKVQQKQPFNWMKKCRKFVMKSRMHNNISVHLKKQGRRYDEKNRKKR